jgi:Ubiquitin carboxyl-terminal hydrolase
MLKLRAYNPEYVAPPIGFRNNGVICWFNSLMQMLLGVSSFNECMIENKESLEFNQLAATYIKFAEAIMPNDGSYDPNDLAKYSAWSQEILRGLIAVRPDCQLGVGQQCSAEGFTMVLQGINEKFIDEIFMNAYRQQISCTRCGKSNPPNRDVNNHIRVPATKNFTSRAELDAWRVNVSRLPLDDPARSVIPNFRTQGEFQKWIHKHTSTTSDYACEFCGYKAGINTRDETIALIMDALVISFDKFNQVDPTWFPSELLFNSSNKKTALRYQLCGRICWSGTARIVNGAVTSSGHFWAHSLRESKWYCFNDEQVSPGSPLPDQYTFMIAYHFVGEVAVLQNGAK